jgi:hypothetical protein
MKKYDIVVGIDPDVDKSGCAFLEVSTRKLEVSTLTFPHLLDYLQFVKKTKDEGESKEEFPSEIHVAIVVEAGWLNRSNWHLKNSDSKRIASAKGNSTGRNHEVGRKIVEMAKHYGLEVIEQPPLRKFWKGKDGKITHEELAHFTGIMGSTNQEGRDAALIAWNYAGLPVKMRAK